MMRARIALCFVCAALLFDGCKKSETVETPTGVLLRIHNTDDALQAKMTRLRVTLSVRKGSGWSERPPLELASRDLKWPVDIPITPSTAANSDNQIELVVDALAEDMLVAQARAITAFVLDKQKVLEVFLYVCPGHTLDEGYVCAVADCPHDACEVCNVTGACVAVTPTPTSDLLPFKPGEKPQNRPSPGFGAQPSVDGGPTDGGSDGGPETGSDAGSDAGADAGPANPPCKVNADGTCKCESGYEDDGDGRCRNIDDCKGDPCGDAKGVQCADGVNHYTCRCDSGYTGGGDKECKDIDECDDGLEDACGMGATGCDNTDGSYECSCEPGYGGDGKTACKEIDECGETNVCTDSYPCQNQTPYYVCRGQFAEWTPTYSSTTFTVNGNNTTVTDSHTGLVWERGFNATLYTWQQAVDHCADLPLEGGDWRLPTVAEFQSIVDFSQFDPAFDLALFPNILSREDYDDAFWTSSLSANDSNYAWHVETRQGAETGEVLSKKYYARCVR